MLVSSTIVPFGEYDRQQMIFKYNNYNSSIIVIIMEKYYSNNNGENGGV